MTSFIISSVDHCIDFACGVVMKEDPAFDPFSEKEVARFGEEFFFFAVALDK